MGLSPNMIDGADAADLLVFEVPSLSSLISGAAAPVPLTELAGARHA
jgi:hypothetical protein